MVTLIIPAYNEEENIERVLDVVCPLPLFQQILVIDDGSGDATYDKIKQYPVESIRFDVNRGKAAAILTGVQSARSPVLCLLDADLIGLQKTHIERLLHPVLHEGAAMSLGQFGTGRLATDLAQRVAPNLSGQRAMRREVIETFPKLEWLVRSRYGFEVALTRHARRSGWETAVVPLEDLTHRMKEEKRGLLPGFGARLRMYWDIMRVLARR